MHTMLEGHSRKCSRKLLGAKRDDGFCSRKLAESIILQAIEDLWNRDIQQESIAFFNMKDFSCCAQIAGMDLYAQMKLLTIVNGAISPSGKIFRNTKNP